MIFTENKFFMWWSFIRCKHNEKWWDFDQFSFIYAYQPKFRSLRSFGRGNSGFLPKFSSIFNWTPSTRDIDIWCTSQVDFLIYSVHMDKPFGIPINREEKIKKFRLHWVCNTPRHF